MIYLTNLLKLKCAILLMTLRFIKEVWIYACDNNLKNLIRKLEHLWAKVGDEMIWESSN